MESCDFFVSYTSADRPWAEQILGSDHPDTLGSRSSLAGAYRASGRLDQAVMLYGQALAGAQGNLGVDHPITNRIRANLQSARESIEPR